MPSAQHSVTIRRPVEGVFAFVADGQNAPKWRSGVMDIEHVSGQGLGAAYKQGVKGPGGRRIAADYEVTGYEPNRRLAFKTTAGPVRPAGEFRFEQVPEGTRLTFSLEAQLTGPKKLLMGRAVQKTMDSETRAIEHIKRIMEA
jgi:uncharacterized protein YndB with AHSA1/START domain